MGMPTKPNCRDCGVVKTLENTGSRINPKTGKVTFYYICKECDKEKKYVRYLDKKELWEVVDIYNDHMNLAARAANYIQEKYNINVCNYE